MDLNNIGSISTASLDLMELVKLDNFSRKVSSTGLSLHSPSLHQRCSPLVTFHFQKQSQRHPELEKIKLPVNLKNITLQLYPANTDLLQNIQFLSIAQQL